MNTALIDKRLLFGYAYGCMASGIIIAHNHPSGYVKPSKADYLLTKDIISVSKIIGIDLLDHLVIGDDGYYSFLGAREVTLELKI